MKEITVRTSTTRGEETKCCRTFGSVLDRFPFVLVEPPFSFVCSFSFPFSVSFSFSFDAIDFFDGPASALVEDEPFVSFAAAFFSHLDATRSSLRLAEVRGTIKVTCVYQQTSSKPRDMNSPFAAFFFASLRRRSSSAIDTSASSELSSTALEARPLPFATFLTGLAGLCETGFKLFEVGFEDLVAFGCSDSDALLSFSLRFCSAS